MPLSGLATCGTAGQRGAAEALGEALAKRPPLILLFGEMGVGKSTLLGRFLATVDAQEFAVVQLSATGGEFTGPPSLDVLLEFICRQLVAPQPTRERPATLAVLANAVGTLARAGRAAVIAIDHADHLRDEVISGVAKLAKHLDVPPASIVCIFIGSPALASRLDRVLRKPGSPEKVIEIRVSQPSAEELAALLAYEDMAQPDGPMLTPGAIDRISVYAKSNLHWAVPLADAARTLAAAQGEREVSPELVRGALLELWAPDQQPYEILTSYTLDPDGSTTPLLGMSDISRPSPTDTEPAEAPGVSPVDETSPEREPAYWGDPTTSSAEAPRAPSMAPEGLLGRPGGVGSADHNCHRCGLPSPDFLPHRARAARGERAQSKPMPPKPALPEPMLPETASAPMPGAGGQSPPPQPTALDAPTPKVGLPRAAGERDPGGRGACSKLGAPRTGARAGTRPASSERRGSQHEASNREEGSEGSEENRGRGAREMDPNAVRRSLLAAVCSLVAACTEVADPPQLAAPPIPEPAPGRKLVMMPEAAWQTASCASRPLPFIRLDRSEVTPPTVRRGKSIIYRFGYTACVPAQPGYILGQFRTAVVLDGKELSTRIDKTYPIDTGGWIVDTDIAVPSQAEPGLYRVEATLVAKDATVQDRINFVVQP